MKQTLQQSRLHTPQPSFLKVLSVTVLNIAILVVVGLLAYEIYSNRYGLGFVCLIIALVLGVPLVLAVDLWAISGITVYTGRNVNRIRTGVPHSPTTITQEQFQAMLNNAQVVLDNQQTGGRLADGRTADGGRTIDEETDVESHKRKILLYCQTYPGSSYAQIAKSVELSKSRVGELMLALREEGQV